MRLLQFGKTLTTSSNAWRQIAWRSSI